MHGKSQAKEPEIETEPEPELIDGALRLVVMEARKLKPMDRVGKNDPYVQVRVPMWNPGACGYDRTCARHM